MKRRLCDPDDTVFLALIHEYWARYWQEPTKAPKAVERAFDALLSAIAADLDKPAAEPALTAPHRSSPALTGKAATA